MSQDEDIKDLAKFGYRQELDRTLGSFSSFAAGFSYISILTGMFQMFFLGFGIGGPAFIWSWPIVFIGQFLVALMFAELAAHYPLSGGVFQWSKIVGNAKIGWLVGWIYIACLVVTLSAVALALQNSLPQISPFFQFASSNAVNAIVLGCVLILFSTVLNSTGVGLLAKVNNLGVFTEIFGVVVLIVLLACYALRSPSEIIFDTQNRGTLGDGYFGTLLAAASLTASYVMYGFDTAGSLAEETENPRQKAPRAILQALSAAAAAGLLLLLFSMMAAPNLSDPLLGRIEGGLPLIIKSVLGEGLGSFFLLIVIFAIFVCALAVHTGAVRLIFAMARDGWLPFSPALSRVSKNSKIPVVPAILVGILAIAILVANVNFPKVVELLTLVAILWANLAYLLVVACLLYRRLNGWPQKGGSEVKGLFSLGRFGLALNFLAFFWSLFMVINVGWPRAEVYGPEWTHRLAPVGLTVILLILGFGFRRLVFAKMPRETLRK